jgi:hypothetical protein
MGKKKLKNKIKELEHSILSSSIILPASALKFSPICGVDFNIPYLQKLLRSAVHHENWTMAKHYRQLLKDADAHTIRL